MFESSDGRLWFSKYLDAPHLGEGTGWLNPQINAGCLITTRPTTLVEDDDQQLWIAVEGVLYSSDLSAQFGSP